jgi:hypothetical protein
MEKRGVFKGSNFETNEQAALGMFQLTYEFPAKSMDLQESLVFAGMGDLVISDANSPYPIVSTKGLADCMAIVGYEPNKQIGFITHLPAQDTIINGIDHLFNQFTSYIVYAGGSIESVKISLFGGLKNASENLLKSIQKSTELFKMTIESQEYMLRNFNPTTKPPYSEISLDTRTGEIFFNSPKKNYEISGNNMDYGSFNLRNKKLSSILLNENQVHPIGITYLPPARQIAVIQTLDNFIEKTYPPSELNLIDQILDYFIKNDPISYCLEENFIHLAKILIKTKLTGENLKLDLNICSKILSLIALYQQDSLFILYSQKFEDHLTLIYEKTFEFMLSQDLFESTHFQWLHQKGAVFLPSHLLSAINSNKQNVALYMIKEGENLINTIQDDVDFPLFAALYHKMWPIVTTLVNKGEKIHDNQKENLNYLDTEIIQQFEELQKTFEKQ